MSAKRVTLNSINDALHQAGAPEECELVRGDGYFYFWGDERLWPDTSVMTLRLSDLSVEQWVGEWQNKREAYDKRFGPPDEITQSTKFKIINPEAINDDAIIPENHQKRDPKP